MVHPKYLDTIELIHSWRSGLMAQKHCRESEVLNLALRENKQFEKFYDVDDDKRLKSVGYYLLELWNEAGRREYKYNKELIDDYNFTGKILVNYSEIRDDFIDLLDRYRARSKNFFYFIKSELEVEVHPIFYLKKDNVESRVITLPKTNIIL